MIIATSITESYLTKSFPFFDSVNKHFKGKRICFCMGFKTEIEGWEVIEVPMKNLECIIEGFPNNRKEFLTLQYGEFIKYYDFKDENEKVLFVDSDMVLQRDLTFDFNYDISDLFLVTNSSFPPTRIEDVIPNVECKLPTKTILKRYKLTGQEEEFCSGFMIATVKSWRELFEYIKVIKDDFLTDFNHHAAWQLLINVALLKHKSMEPLVLNPIMCNASWYSGTRAINKDGVLMYHDNAVYFNHTKFNEEYKY